MKTMCLDFNDGGHDWGLGPSINSKIDYDLANGKHNSGSSGGGSGGGGDSGVKSIIWAVIIMIVLAAASNGWAGVLAIVIVLVGILGTVLLVLYLKHRAGDKNKE